MQGLTKLFALQFLIEICLLITAKTDDVSLFATKCEIKDKGATLLDIANDFINQTKKLFPTCIDDDSACETKEKAFTIIDIAMNLISDVKNNYPTCVEKECPLNYVPRPMDCTEIYQSGKNQSGVYDIWPRNRLAHRPLKVHCDMDTDGGGWTVIQRRRNFSTPKDYFYKNWNSYKNGFGNLLEEFWIGNDNIYFLSNQARYTIRFDLEDATGDTGYAEYRTFWIENEAAKYQLNIQNYTGNVGDAMSYNHQQKFSTKDQNNNGNPLYSWCPDKRRGAWWYKGCTMANLNGLYQPGVDSDMGITWQQWKENWVSLAGVEIKLKQQFD